MIPLYILAIEDEDDREFIIEIYRKYEKVLYSVANRITNNYWDTQDVVQSVMVKIIADKIPLLRELSERKRVNYLVTACSNTAFNYIKKKKHIIENRQYDECETDIDRSDNLTLTLEDLVLKKEAQSAFFEVWESLDERTKFFLNARYVLELSTAEIAKEIGVSPAQVRSYLSRARKKALAASNDFLQENNFEK